MPDYYSPWQMGLLSKLVVEGRRAWRRVRQEEYRTGEELRKLWTLTVQGLRATDKMKRIRRLPRLR